MSLSSDLVSQFAKITNDGNERESKEVTLYGEIVQFEDSLCVKFDGSNELTPAVTTSTIKVGDRVSAVIKNHTAIVTGNFSDPSASSDALNGIKTTTSSIDLVVRDYGIRIDNMGVKFTGLIDGTTIIDGACIKTGMIDAERLNLKGAITFADLDEETQTIIENAAPVSQFSVDGINDWHDIMTSSDYFRRDSTDGGETWSAVYQFRGKDGANGSSASVPNYIKRTYIDSVEIQSPTIKGNDISVYGTFQTIGDVGGNIETTGYMGAAKGMTGDGVETYGVALSNSWNAQSYAVGENYVIVTNGGIRLQAGENRLYITDEGLRINIDNGGAYYNGQEIGSGGSSSVIAVWG